jgi:hypothetical protein
MTKPMPEDVPKALDAIADVVLAYKPKAKTKVAKKRKKRAAKIVKEAKPPLDLR